MALLLAGALAGTVAGVRQTRSASMQAYQGDEGRVKGARGAKMSVVEYFDYQCGACRMAYQLFEEYERAFPGSIRIEMRYYPLPGHPHGLKAAIHAECAAAQGKFWPFHDRLMQNQPQWASLPDAAPTFRNYAIETGVDAAAFDACVANPETEIRVLKEKEGGIALGVKLTPTCLINGEMIAGSNAVADELKKTFGELKKAS